MTLTNPTTGRSIIVPDGLPPTMWPVGFQKMGGPNNPPNPTKPEGVLGKVLQFGEKVIRLGNPIIDVAMAAPNSPPVGPLGKAYDAASTKVQAAGVSIANTTNRAGSVLLALVATIGGWKLTPKIPVKFRKLWIFGGSFIALLLWVRALKK